MKWLSDDEMATLVGDWWNDEMELPCDYNVARNLACANDFLAERDLSITVTDYRLDSQSGMCYWVVG